MNNNIEWNQNTTQKAQLRKSTTTHRIKLQIYLVFKKTNTKEYSPQEIM